MRSIAALSLFDVCTIDECALLPHPAICVPGSALKYVAIPFIRVDLVLRSSAMRDGTEWEVTPSSLLTYHLCALFYLLNSLACTHPFRLGFFATVVHVPSFIRFHSREDSLSALPLERIVSRSGVVCTDG